MLGLYAHIAFLPYDLYLEYGSHICSVVYDKYVCPAPWWMIGASHLISGICMCTHPLYMYLKYLWYKAYMPKNFIKITK